MKQIIYAWNYLGWGGAQTYLLSLMRTARREFDVKVLIPEGSDEQLIRFIENEGVEYSYFSPAYDPGIHKGLKAKLAGRRAKIQSEAAMLKALARFDLSNSIVHVDLSPWYSLHPLVWLLLRTTVFFTMHNAVEIDDPVRRLTWKIKMRLLSRFRNFNVFASNKHCKEFFRGYYSDDLFSRMRVTYTNVTLSEIEEVSSEAVDRSGLRRTHGIDEDSFLFVCVGQFIDRKGRWTFLEAAKSVLERDPTATFAWIANYRPEDSDLARAESFGLQNRFRLITSDEVGGDHSDLIRLLRAADGFALPSYVEGLPIALLEAMAAGLPSISTNVYAIPEAIIDDETGLLVEPGDSAGLAAAMLRIIAEPDLRSRLSENGRRRVLERFTDRVAGETALEAYIEATR